MIGRMRRAGLLLLLALPAPACAHETAAPPVAARPAPTFEPPAAAQPGPPPQYVVGDPPKPAPLTMVPLAEGGTGFVVEGLRIVSRAGTVHAGNDAPDQSIQAAWRVPSRLGGGYLFRAGQ